MFLYICYRNLGIYYSDFPTYNIVTESVMLFLPLEM